MKLAKIFKDHMVIQRNNPFFIWGTGDEGEKISITIDNVTKENVVKDGKWVMEFAPMEAARDLEIVISTSGDMKVIKDVAVGEVWLAGGQSNMEFYMLFDQDYEDELNICENPDLRFFDYPEVSYPEQECDFDYSQMGLWRKCTGKSLKYYSAAAYYFAKKIQKDLNVPVGIIGCNWGGTTASCWMSEQYLKRSGQVWIRDYEEQLAHIKDLDDYIKMWRKHPINDKGNPFADPFLLKMMSSTTREEQLEMMSSIDSSYEQILNGPLSPNRPCGLYHTMLKHIAPYGIKGVIWYQGESDRIHGDIYRNVFIDMVQCWRELWKENLVFITVQLAPFEAWLGESGEGFPKIREQQRLAANEKEIYMVSVSDVGERYDIHPKRKKPVGERLAFMAEEKVYGFSVTADAPEGVLVKSANDGFEIYFTNVGMGLEIVGEKLNALEIKGTDGNCLQIISCEPSGNHIYVCTQDYRPGQYTVLFAQTPYYEVNLYNSYGIPAIPFLLKTDVSGENC